MRVKNIIGSLQNWGARCCRKISVHILDPNAAVASNKSKTYRSYTVPVGPNGCHSVTTVQYVLVVCCIFFNLIHAFRTQSWKQVVVPANFITIVDKYWIGSQICDVATKSTQSFTSKASGVNLPLTLTSMFLTSIDISYSMSVIYRRVFKEMHWNSVKRKKIRKNENRITNQRTNGPTKWWLIMQ